MKPVGGLEERKLVPVLFADLAPEARGKVLAEIRHMLESVNDILRGVATNDLVAVEKAARAAGTAVAVEMEPAMMRQLLPAFRELGLQTHRALDDLADGTKAGGTGDDAIRGLAGGPGATRVALERTGEAFALADGSDGARMDRRTPRAFSSRARERTDLAGQP